MDFDRGLLKEFIAVEEKNQQALVEEASRILENDNSAFTKFLKAEKLRIVSLHTIKSICLKYRLRFLEFSHFKGEVPADAIQELERLKKEYNLRAERLKIVAPGELFRLENREKDPILLAEISDGRFVVVYKWGGEFNAIRILKALPMRNIFTMAFSVLLIAFVFSLLLIPFAGGENLPLKEFLFGFGIVWLSCLSYATFLALSQNIFPTSMIWNSKFLD